MKLSISYFKAALICNIPLFLLPVGVLLSIKYGGYPGEDYPPFGSRADSMITAMILFWLPVVITVLFLLLLAKKDKILRRNILLICITIGVFAAILLYPILVFVE
jgi:cytochrome bd-type quinol oxidase subunit 2